MTSPPTDRRVMIDFEAIFVSMPTPFMMLDADLRFIAANLAYLAMTSRREADLIGRHVFDVFPDTPAREAVIQRAFALALAGTENTLERFVFAIDRPGAGRMDVYWDVHHVPVRDSAGVVVGVLQHGQDVTEKVEAERMRDVISQEYDHRVRNMMTRISAIARHTARQSYDTEMFLADFDRRIVSMARTHALLIEGGWDSLRLRGLVESALQPHVGDELRQISITGEDQTLSSRVGQALGMALHELATNAAKYGTLTHDDGLLAVSWTVNPDGSLRIEWRETGLTDVPVAMTPGFGTTIIDRILPMESGGTVERTLTPTGLLCTIVLPDPLRV